MVGEVKSKSSAPANKAVPKSRVKTASEPVAAAPVAEPVAPASPIVAEPVDVQPAIAPAVVEETATATPDEPVSATELAYKEGMTMVDVIESTKKIADDAKAQIQTAFADMSEKAKATAEKSAKAMEEMTTLAKGNVEALVESGKIAAKGVETMGQTAAEFGKSSFEKTSAAMKSMAAVKSPTEFFQLQSELLSASFDDFAKETAKASEALLKLAGDVAQPISTRVSIVSEKVKSFAA